jgi:hypothetical protein
MTQRKSLPHFIPPFPNGSTPQLAPHVQQGGNPHQGKQCSHCGQYGVASYLGFVSWVQWQVSLSLAKATSGILPAGAITVRGRLHVHTHRAHQHVAFRGAFEGHADRSLPSQLHEANIVVQRLNFVCLCVWPAAYESLSCISQVVSLHALVMLMWTGHNLITN